MAKQKQIATRESHALVLVNAGALDRNPAAVYLASLAPGSRRTMGDALNEIADKLTVGRVRDAFLIDWGAVRFQHAAAVRSKLAESQSAATVNKKLAALRGALRAAFLLGRMSAEDYARTREIERVKGESIPAGRALGEGEIEALLRMCAKGSGGARDGAIIALMRMGLRRAEVCALDVKDFDAQAGALKVHGKGNKVRIVYIKNGAALWFGDWLHVRGDVPGPVFFRVLKGGKIVRERITTQTVFDLLQRRARQAGVKDISPHDFRRTFVGDLLDAGADISTVQRLAGHESVETTARYDRRGEVAKQKATELLHVPYFGRLGK